MILNIARLSASNESSNATIGAFAARRHGAGYFAIASGSLHSTLFDGDDDPSSPSRFMSSISDMNPLFALARVAAPRLARADVVAVIVVALAHVRIAVIALARMFLTRRGTARTTPTPRGRA